MAKHVGFAPKTTARHPKTSECDPKSDPHRATPNEATESLASAAGGRGICGGGGDLVAGGVLLAQEEDPPPLGLAPDPRGALQPEGSAGGCRARIAGHGEIVAGESAQTMRARA